MNTEFRKIVVINKIVFKMINMAEWEKDRLETRMNEEYWKAIGDREVRKHYKIESNYLNPGIGTLNSSRVSTLESSEASTKHSSKVSETGSDKVSTTDPTKSSKK